MCTACNSVVEHLCICIFMVSSSSHSPAPLPNTVIDFWRLIWQEKCPSIVMLTNLVEGGNIKCLQCCPDTGNKSYGPFKVTITDKQMFADYWIRVFQVQKLQYNYVIKLNTNQLPIGMVQLEIGFGHKIIWYSVTLIWLHQLTN